MHTPQLRTPAEKWHLFLEKDQKDRRFSYQELLSKARPEIGHELNAETFKSKYNACQTALARLRTDLAESSPDVAIVIGDDQHEQFWEDNMPMFSIYYGESVEQIPRSAQNRKSWWGSDSAYSDQAKRTLKCDSNFARHLIEHLIGQGFDIAASNKLKADIR